jgi:apolipoprotein N-acyltransferase
MTFQHANICRFRAVETGVPVARCANTGLSCFIDPFGRMEGVTQIFTRVIDKKAMPCLRKDTFFSRHGDIAGWGCLWAGLSYFIILFILSRFRKKHG